MCGNHKSSPLAGWISQAFMLYCSMMGKNYSLVLKYLHPNHDHDAADGDDGDGHDHDAADVAYCYTIFLCCLGFKI